MNLGATHSGAVLPRAGAAFAIAAPERTAASQVQPLSERPVEPAPRAAPARAELREQILADKGVTLADIAALPGSTRLLLEARIEAEIARRSGVRLLDLRV